MPSNMKTAVPLKQPDRPWYEGLTEKNTVLVSGLVIAPVVVMSTDMIHTLTYALMFTAVTFITLLIASFVPRNIVYTIRIILYVVIAALVYVPSAVLLSIQNDSLLRIYLPLIITNGLILSKAETHFFKLSKGRMLLEIISYIAGFDIVMILMGAIRELFGKSTFFGSEVSVIAHIPALSEPFGGMILLGLLCALYRQILNSFGQKKRKEC